MNLKCFWNYFKKEFKGKRKVSTILLGISALLIIIVLPSGPDDLYTTLPLIVLLGLKKYLVLAGIVVIIFIINARSFAKVIHKIRGDCKRW